MTNSTNSIGILTSHLLRSLVGATPINLPLDQPGTSKFQLKGLSQLQLYEQGVRPAGMLEGLRDRTYDLDNDYEDYEDYEAKNYEDFESPVDEDDDDQAVEPDPDLHDALLWGPDVETDSPPSTAADSVGPARARREDEPVSKNRTTGARHKQVGDIVVHVTPNGTRVHLRELLPRFAYHLWNQRLVIAANQSLEKYETVASPHYIKAYATIYLRTNAPHLLDRVKGIFRSLRRFILKLHNAISQFDRHNPGYSNISRIHSERVLFNTLPVLAMNNVSDLHLNQLMQPLTDEVAGLEADRKRAGADRERLRQEESARHAEEERTKVLNYRRLEIKSFYGIESVRGDYSPGGTSYVSPEEFLKYVTGPDKGHDYRYVEPPPNLGWGGVHVTDYRVSGDNGDHIFMVTPGLNAPTERWYFRTWQCREYTTDNGVSWLNNTYATPYDEEGDIRRQELNAHIGNRPRINNRLQLQHEREYPDRYQDRGRAGGLPLNRPIGGPGPRLLRRTGDTDQLTNSATNATTPAPTR